MHKKLWCSSVFTVFWVLITLWWPLGSSAPLVRYLPSRSNLVITPWCTPLQPPILQYHNIILFCCLSVRPRQRLTNNWTKFWQFICSYLFLCQCCCQLFYFWSASVNSSFMARQQPAVELETKVIRRFVKVSTVSYSRPSLMIIASASQFHVYLLWGQHLFSMSQ